MASVLIRQVVPWLNGWLEPQILTSRSVAYGYSTTYLFLSIVPHGQLPHLLSSTSFEMITARTVQIFSSLKCSMACFWHTASATWLHHSCTADSLASHSFASGVGSDDLIGSHRPNRTIWDFSWDFCSGPLPLILVDVHHLNVKHNPFVRVDLLWSNLQRKRWIPVIIQAWFQDKGGTYLKLPLACLHAFLSYPSFAGIVTSSDGRTKRANHLRIHKPERSNVYNSAIQYLSCWDAQPPAHTVSIREPCFSLLSRTHSCPRSLTFSPQIMQAGGLCFLSSTHSTLKAFHALRLCTLATLAQFEHVPDSALKACCRWSMWLVTKESDPPQSDFQKGGHGSLPFVVSNCCPAFFKKPEQQDSRSVYEI